MRKESEPLTEEVTTLLKAHKFLFHLEFGARESNGANGATYVCRFLRQLKAG